MSKSGFGRAKSRSAGQTAGVNAHAIVFDAVSTFVVQPSAAGGVVPPVLILLLLLAFRHRLFLAKTQVVTLSASPA
ncbi:MAG TPA: hypothetical protein VEY12_12910 [Thermoplasmata archaeon]|nr:hypothetical protein [Thermoplasmata archaeon]